VGYVAQQLHHQPGIGQLPDALLSEFYMQLISCLKISALFIAIALLSACGGGASGSDSTSSSATTEGPAGPASFLLFPNPQKQSDNSLQVDSNAYATAYYQAIDPNNERDTLAKFKTKNGFGTSGAGITEESIIIGDQRDLGYGRKMTARIDSNTGNIAFVVENYLVGGYGAYTSINLEAAIVGESKWHIGTNAIEFSVVETGAANPSPNAVKFVKFYTYDPITGARLYSANLDGRGNKAMPTICITCHGGRGDPLTPSGLFPKLMNVASGARGDVGAQLHAFEPASFDFSTRSGFTRASLEAKIKTINKMVLCGHNLPNGTVKPTGNAEDDCRRVANPNEYQGTAAAHLKHMYGGDGLPNAASSATDTYVPTSWASNGQSNLYSKTVNQACRVCHGLRGNGNQSDINFEDFTAFDAYAARIKAHVIDRGNMPLAKLVYDKYWTTPEINGPLTTYLTGKGYSDGNLKPGRPVADPGPDRVIKSNSTTLSGALSLYSTGYQWTVTSGSASLTNANTSTPTFTATGGNGTYTVQLITTNGTATSTAKSLTIEVNSALAWDPTALRFNPDIRTILQAGGGACQTCHVSGQDIATTSGVPPIFYDDFARSGSGVGSDATNRNWLYTEVRGRVNFNDIVASPLLRKPSGNHHNGGLRTGFNTGLAVGDAGRVDYDKIVAWVLNGAPEN
jgi:mono/diheme cytochrome c family protein